MPRAFAIVPAAGRSLRMGRPKLLLPWGSGRVIDAVLQAWSASCVDVVVVVVHPDDALLVAACGGERVEVVRPDSPPPEMKDSVLCGLNWIAAHHRPRPEDCWLLAPGDLPTLSAASIDAVLAEHRPAEPAILVPQWQGRRGHPVLFPWPLAAAARLLQGDEGLNRLQRQFPVRAVDLSTAPILDDLDTPEGYRRLHDRCHPPDKQR